MNRILFLVLFTIAGVTFTYFMSRPKPETESLPVINPIDVPEDMVDPELLRVGYGHTIGKFAFKNQDNKTITQEDVRGKVYVVEYFFTTCKTICPRMNAQMQRVHEKFRKNANVKLLSFSVDPETDSVEQLKRYANAHNCKGNQWHFLTGKREAIYALARTSFFTLKPTEAENQGDVGSDFIHTNNFVLIDKKMRIRAYYDGTNPTDVDKMMHDMNLLLAEK
jgi:protein SCO1/2